jgi:hypothetical protein
MKSFTPLTFPIVLLMALDYAASFQLPDRAMSRNNLDSVGGTVDRKDYDLLSGAVDRKKFFQKTGLMFLLVAAAPEKSNAKSYSANARNMERMDSGDMSGGSVYDNNPKSVAGKRRRAMTGCKVSVAREEAAESVLKISTGISEMDCNRMVLGEGDSEFMLQALRNLDCPTCPYGINTSRR